MNDLIPQVNINDTDETVLARLEELAALGVKTVQPTTQPDTRQILATRGSTHGDFTDNGRIMQALKDLIHNHKNGANDVPTFPYLSPAHREALDMIAHKIGRILSGNANERDHWIDIAGYATLAADRCKPNAQSR